MSRRPDDVGAGGGGGGGNGGESEELGAESESLNPDSHFYEEVPLPHIYSNFNDLTVTNSLYENIFHDFLQRD